MTLPWQETTQQVKLTTRSAWCRIGPDSSQPAERQRLVLENSGQNGRSGTAQRIHRSRSVKEGLSGKLARTGYHLIAVRAFTRGMFIVDAALRTSPAGARYG